MSRSQLIPDSVRQRQSFCHRRVREGTAQGSVSHVEAATARAGGLLAAIITSPSKRRERDAKRRPGGYSRRIAGPTSGARDPDLRRYDGRLPGRRSRRVKREAATATARENSGTGEGHYRRNRLG